MVDISERSLEATIEQELLAGGPDAVKDPAGFVRERPIDYGEPWPAAPGGYRRRAAEEDDRELYLIERDVLGFLMATQPKVWQRLQTHHRAGVKPPLPPRPHPPAAKSGK